MKKNKFFLNAIASSLCAAALLFGAVSCANNDDDDSTPAKKGFGVLADGTATGRKAVTAPKTAGEIKMNGTAYGTIKEALTAAASASGDCEITLGEGTYNEDGLSYSGNNNLKIKGLGTAEYGLDVVIYGKGSNVDQEKTRSTLAIAGKGNIVLENLTIKSSRQETEGTAQAEVIGTDGTGNLAAYNCSFLSGQDTLRTVAKAWFYKCYIEGDVDFTWMEYTNGVVALYEECVLRAIGTRTDKAYFTAPRLGLTSKVGKGLVIYKCTLEAESGLEKLYLGRNPWATSNLKDYYEQVAFIGTTLNLPEGVTLNADVWASQANGTSDQKYIGFKTDDYFPAGKYGVVLNSSFVAKEYAGRENILNRLFVVASSKFQKDTETYWNVAKVISDNGWNVKTDASKSLLDGEKDPAELTKTYTLNSASVEGLTCDGFALETGKPHYVGQNGATIKFPVTEKAVVTVTGYYKGTGTIKAGEQGAALFDFNNGSTSKFIEKTYTVYGGACDVSIAATGTTYITKIVVENDDSLAFKPVTGIKVTAAEDATTLASKKSLQFSAKLTPDSKEVTNSDIVWSITKGSEVATIDQKGLLTAGAAAADTEVTVRATSCDANAVYGEATVTVKKLESKACDITWFTGEEFSLAGTSSDEAALIAGEAKAEYLAGFADQPVTTACGKVNTTTGSYWQCTSAAATGGSEKVAFFKLTVPVTAVQNVKITNITGTFDESVTSNLVRTISVNGSEEVEIGDGKVVSLNKEFDVAVSAGQTVNVVITTYVKASKSIAASKAAKECVSKLCVGCEKQ